MNKRYLSKNYKGLNSAGNKAKTDIETTLLKLGYKNIGIKQTRYNNKIAGFLVTLLGVLKAPFSLSKGDILVLQYPLKKYYSFVCKMAHLRGCKVITIIHDLGAFRRKKLTIKEEIARLNNSDYIIAHNESMKNWLLENHSKAKIGTLEIFDYLSAQKAKVKDIPTLPYAVVYAGALSKRKNAFLYELDDFINSYHFNLYGGGFNLDYIKNKEAFSYKGFIPSDELITTAKGHFGLVWDGDSITECSGVNGEYLKYNNPHKTSLYIRCLLPIIIWKKAALAPFIQKNKIGICVDSLENLGDILSNISIDEYKNMKQNTETISDKLADGWYIEQALNKAVEEITIL